MHLICIYANTVELYSAAVVFNILVVIVLIPIAFLLFRGINSQIISLSDPDLKKEPNEDLTFRKYYFWNFLVKYAVLITSSVQY